MGLSTVYGIVRQAEGQITVDSELGHGTVFRVYLPIVADEARGTRAPAQPSAARGNEVVLIVEDEAGVRRLINRVLVEQGYRVLTASDGAEALQLSTSYAGHIDLLVTDVVMPELGGGALVEAMRRQRPDLRVLYMSGYTDDEVVRHGIEVARQPFLVKPFSSADLARKVREVLDHQIVN